MAEVFCISRPASYDDTIHSFYIDDSVLENTTQFSSGEISSGGSSYNFKLPVGVFRYASGTDATYLSVFAKNNFQGCLVWYQGQTRYAKPTTDQNPNVIGTSFGVQKSPTYGDAIPFFNNAIDASNYSMGLEYDASNWVGGKPLTPPVVPITSNGGGATHIAKRAGLLSSIGASNLSDILMVSGGGGGGLIIGEDVYAGKDAGGISGNGNNSANQTTGYAFGQGESDEGVPGGGGGLYGGSKGVII